LSVIKSVQINSSSQSIAGTLRAPKSSLLAMVLVPLARGSFTTTPKQALGSVTEGGNVGGLLQPLGTWRSRTRPIGGKVRSSNELPQQPPPIWGLRPCSSITIKWGRKADPRPLLPSWKLPMPLFVLELPVHYVHHYNGAVIERVLPLSEARKACAGRGVHGDA